MQSALCLGTGEVLDCATHRTFACNPSYPRCESFFDAPRELWGATCFEEGSTACSESDPVLRCDGSTLVSCNANINYPASGPPHVQRRASCPEFYGPEAVCVSDGSAGPRCDIPTAPACEEASHRLECTSDLGGALICGSLGRVVTSPCGPDARCLDNASTRAAGGVACVPTDATPSTHGPSADRAYLRCESPMQIRVEQFGLEWTERCDPTLVFVSDGAGGFREEYRDQVCYAGAGGVRCEQVGTEHCDPATFPTTCDMDGMSSRSCEVDELRVQRCNVFGLDYPCDTTTGLCAAVEPCNPRFPFNSRCVLGGAYHTVCHPAEGIAIPEPCAGCVEESGGTTRCD